VKFGLQIDPGMLNLSQDESSVERFRSIDRMLECLVDESNKISKKPATTDVVSEVGRMEESLMCSFVPVCSWVMILCRTVARCNQDRTNDSKASGNSQTSKVFLFNQ